MSPELLKFKGKVTLEHLWFTKMDKIWEVMVLNKVQQIIFVPPKSLNIPDNHSQHVGCESFSWIISIYVSIN